MKKSWRRHQMKAFFALLALCGGELSNHGLITTHAKSSHVDMDITVTQSIWRRHQMETFSALLAICAGNSPVPGEFPAQRPVTRTFDIFFDLRLDKRLSKQSWGWWFEMLLCPLWRHRNDIIISLWPQMALGYYQDKLWRLWRISCNYMILLWVPWSFW